MDMMDCLLALFSFRGTPKGGSDGYVSWEKERQPRSQGVLRLFYILLFLRFIIFGPFTSLFLWFSEESNFALGEEVEEFLGKAEFLNF